MTSKLKIFLLSVIFLLGYTSMSFELIVLRQLVNFVGSNTMVTSIVISIILLFLSLGYYIGSVISFSKKSIRQIIQYIIIYLAIWYILSCSYYLLGGYFYLLYVMGVRSTLSFVMIFSLLFLTFPSTGLGFITSTVGRIIHRSDTAYTGRFMAVDTIGSVLGSLGTTLVLMPLIGCSYTIAFLVILNSLVLLCVSRKRDLSKNAMKFMLLCVFAILVNTEKIINPNSTLIKDDAISRIELVEEDFENGEPLSKEILINGSNSSKISKKEDLMYGYINFINHNYINNLPKDKKHNILILGAGGFTIGKDDDFNDYTYLDIEKSMKDISENQFLEKKLEKNKKFIVEDAYLFMINNKSKYDLIVVDVYSAVFSIPTNFVTVNFFEMIKKSLNDDGIMLMNIITSPSFGNMFSKRMDNTLRYVFGNYLSRQIIQPYNPYEYDLANIVYVYYNKEIDNNIYTMNENSAVYGQELSW